MVAMTAATDGGEATQGVDGLRVGETALGLR